MENTQAYIHKMIAFLSQPENFPEETGEVEIMQTHGSVLALTPNFVYKVKKPVDFGFMDFTTLEKRHANAKRELFLNRRLCEDTYLDIVTITEDDQGNWELGGKQGKVIDYAVKMKRLEDGYFFKTLLKKKEGNLELMKLIGDRLIEFYRDPDTRKAESGYGTVSHIMGDCEDNFKAMEKLPESVADPLMLETVRSFTRSFMDRYQSVFEERKQQGMILECQGDLHLDHIHYKDGKLCIFDCIEFNEAFRSIDITNDLAFLVMDLEHNGYIREASYLTTIMAEGLVDRDLSLLMQFYKVYRACVRGKIHGLAGMDESLSEDERSHHLETAASFFKLALQYACCGPEPSVLILFGPAGSGKSTLTGRLSELLGCPHINSDVIRKQMFNLPANESTPEDMKPELYNPQTTERVYSKITEDGLQYSRAHPTVIVDATFQNPDQRGETRLAFLAAGVKPLFVYVTADQDTLRRRLADRGKGGKFVSDAREQDFDLLVAGYPEPNPENYQGNLLEIDNSEDLDVVMPKLLKLMSIRTMDQLAG